MPLSNIKSLGSPNQLDGNAYSAIDNRSNELVHITISRTALDIAGKPACLQKADEKHDSEDSIAKGEVFISSADF